MTETKDHGGPAFPRTVQAWNGHLTPHDGMTLRDYFAAHAIAAIVTVTSANQHNIHPAKGESYELAMARDAYTIADAMLAARGL